MSSSCTLPANLTTKKKCALVQGHSGLCEGDGYVAYTALVLCQEPGFWQCVLVACIIWMFILFLAVSVAADEFFSPNIANIVTQLKISENIAFYKFASIAGFIAIYVAFVYCVILSRIIGQRYELPSAVHCCLPATGSLITVAQTLPAPEVAGGQTNGSLEISGFVIESNTNKPAHEQNKESENDGGNITTPSVSVFPGTLQLQNLIDDHAINRITNKNSSSKITAVFRDCSTAVFPVTVEEWKKSTMKQIFAIIKAPIILILKLTIPQSGNQWSKLLALIHCFTCPLFAIIATQLVTWRPSNSWPGLWAYSLILSTFPAVFILIFTSFFQEPKFFKITFSSVSKVLLEFLAISLISSLILLPAQRFFLRRWYGVYLIALYVCFIVVVLLTQLGVLFGGVKPDV